MPLDTATAALAEALHDAQSALDQLAAAQVSAEEQTGLIQKAASALSEAQRELERIEADLASKQARLDTQFQDGGAVDVAVQSAQAALDADAGAIGSAALVAVEVALLRALDEDETISTVSGANRTRLDGLYNSVVEADESMGGHAAVADAAQAALESAQVELDAARSEEQAQAAKLEVAFGELSDFSRRISDAVDLTISHLNGASSALLEDRRWEAVVLMTDAQLYRSSLERDVVQPVEGVNLGVTTADVRNAAGDAWNGLVAGYSAAVGARFEKQAAYRETETADALADGAATTWSATRVGRIAEMLAEAEAPPES